ncbi:heavy metal translocating P-type ATPase [Occallatibacter savannae]|uniref:heavy metal translocating P-type ATPase n=1 Tax=Occallatibacter savannae TaxID=1002691 RepID=UPI000D69A2E9|nr:heavy metal translocating P-type ATPase [Occallatibacter savannae]
MPSVATACGLCGLDCNKAAITRTFDANRLDFCCIGCANVYAILLESGVIASGQDIRDTEVFRRSLELGLISNPVSEHSPALEIDPRAPTAEVLLQINGMWCSACGWLIEHALNKLPGIVSAEVLFASDLAKIKYCPLYLPAETIVTRISKLGYRATEFAGDSSAAKADIRDLVMRLGVSAFLWANIMAFSVILYVGYFEQISASASRILPWMLFALTTPMIFYCALPILRSAAIGLWNRQIRMEVLLSLGILAAYGLSIAQTILGRTHLYFDTAAALVTLVLAGKLIERGAKERAMRSIAMLYRLMPKKVRIADSGREHFVSIDALQPGAVFIVKAGERIPADGTIEEGETQADESLLTGESTPISKNVGNQVISGSLNAGGVIRVRTLRTGNDSTLAQIIRMVENAMSSRAPIERTVDRISRTFVPVIIALACSTFVVLSLMHLPVGVALLRAISILVIACPCALGLATPLAITAALGSAAQRGILISDSRVLESMSKVDIVVLDKTGTVTTGAFRLLDFVFAGQHADPAEAFLLEFLPALAGVELLSEHLVGRAVVQFAREHGVLPADVSGVEVRKGQGIVALCKGRRVFVGSSALASAMGAESDAQLAAIASRWQEAGLTVSCFGFEGELAGLLAFGDRIKEGAPHAIEMLRKRGIAVKLASGDAKATTAAIAAELGITDFVGEATPDQKVLLVSDLQRSGRKVAVIGDGVNDAPALAQADLGIALGTGADIAMSAAPIVLVRGTLGAIDETFRLSTRATRIVRQNLFWAFFYNIAGLTLGIAGVLTPIVAAAAMLLSSASVIANSMRLSQSSSPPSAS